MRRHQRLSTVSRTPVDGWDVQQLSQAIARLETRLRLVYCLVYFEGLTVDEVAIVLGQPADEVAALFYWAHVGIIEGTDLYTDSYAVGR